MAKASSVETTNTAWNSTAPLSEFRPYIPESANVPEFTFKAVLFGAIFGIIFGAVTVYVGLRAGLTVSASIPIAVLSISLLRAFGKASILENNIVQTAGSAGESVAAGAIFTLPALIFMGFPFEYSRIFMLALIGGWIGVLFMIPLRRQLIVQEHGNLLYPEGTACADVLVAGEKGGSFASRVFWGLGLGGAYTFLMATAQVWKQRPLYEPAWLPGASFRAEITSEYLGVGYIIGPRIAGTIFAGGVFSWLVLMPAIKFFGEGLAEPLYPSTIPVRDMTPGQLWESYIRPMGAGAVAMAGLITLMKTMPTIVSALRSGMKDIRSQQAGAATAGGRLERDIAMKWVVLGSLAIIVVMWLMLTFNPIVGARTSAFENIVASLFVVLFGFLFVTVSSRICGLIGTSANPVSGMTIATLMATCAMFLAMGWTAPAYSALAITIGGVVCVAAANAGATSQDLKTGFLIGATPYRQQWALMIGVMVSVFVIGGTLMLMNFGLSEFRPMQRALDIDKVRAEQSLRGAAVRVEKELDDPHPQIYRDKPVHPRQRARIAGAARRQVLVRPRHEANRGPVDYRHRQRQGGRTARPADGDRHHWHSQPAPAVAARGDGRISRHRRRTARDSIAVVRSWFVPGAPHDAGHFLRRHRAVGGGTWPEAQRRSRRKRRQSGIALRQRLDRCRRRVGTDRHRDQRPRRSGARHQADPAGRAGFWAEDCAGPRHVKHVCSDDVRAAGVLALPFRAQEAGLGAACGVCHALRSGPPVVQCSPELCFEDTRDDAAFETSRATAPSPATDVSSDANHDVRAVRFEASAEASFAS